MNINIDIDEEIIVGAELVYDITFDYNEAIKNAILSAHRFCKCPFDIEVNVLLTNNEVIHEINLDTRGIDRPTDVLSFPMVEYDEPGDFKHISKDMVELFNQDTGELILGDIVLSMDKVIEQADEYGHSVLREMSFLIIHSMLHLFGYDHMEEDGDIMEKTQEQILQDMNITRDM